MRRREHAAGRRRSSAAGARAGRCMRPSRSAASVAVCSWSRPWIVATIASERVSIHFTGRPREPRGLRQRELLGVDVDLRAEAAADVGRDHAHLRLGDAADRRDERAHEVRHLRRGVERELAAGRDPVGDDGARLDRHRREPLVVDRQRDLDRAPRRRPRRSPRSCARSCSRDCPAHPRGAAARRACRRPRRRSRPGAARSRRRCGRRRRGRRPATRPRRARSARRPCAPCRRPGSAAWAASASPDGFEAHGTPPSRPSVA